MKQSTKLKKTIRQMEARYEKLWAEERSRLERAWAILDTAKEKNDVSREKREEINTSLGKYYEFLKTAERREKKK